MHDDRQTGHVGRISRNELAASYERDIRRVLSGGKICMKK
jgi:hypothetical protein